MKSAMKTIAIVIVAIGVCTLCQSGNLKDWIEHNDVAQILLILGGAQLYFWADVYDKKRGD